MVAHRIAHLLAGDVEQRLGLGLIERESLAQHPRRDLELGGRNRIVDAHHLDDQGRRRDLNRVLTVGLSAR